MNPGPRDLRALTGFSNAGYVLRLQPFSALGYLVSHLVAFFEGLEPLSGYARVVHEDVFAPIIRADEAVALLVAEPLDRSFLGHTFAPAFPVPGPTKRKSHPSLPGGAPSAVTHLTLPAQYTRIYPARHA